jgi:hypothetical protein
MAFQPFHACLHRDARVNPKSRRAAKFKIVRLWPIVRPENASSVVRLNVEHFVVNFQSLPVASPSERDRLFHGGIPAICKISLSSPNFDRITLG